MAGAHAVISASAMKRNIHCAGNLRISRGQPNLSSDAAKEGTAGHILSEMVLRSGKQAADYVGTTIEVEDSVFTVDEEMAEYIQAYVDLIRAEQAKYPGSILHIERRFHLDWLYEGLFGTADAVLEVPFVKIIVFDLKYGRGVPVPVVDPVTGEINPQGAYYGLGAAYGGDYGWIEIVIAQVRVTNGIQRATLTIEELEKWGQDVLLKTCLECEKPDAPLHAGDWCRFCPGKAVCPELMRISQAETGVVVSEHGFAIPSVDALTIEQIQKALELTDILEPWFKDVRSRAKGILLGGGDLPGWKLVEGRKMRSWAYEDEPKLAEDIAKRTGVSKANLYEDPSLRSPAQMEKLLKARKIKLDVIADLIAERRAISMAPGHDKRPAVSSAGMMQIQPYIEE